MEAIILAGGFGTRLKQVVPDVPKPMAPVAGRPFLEILLLRLAAKGFTRIILSLGHMAEHISGHFGSQYAGMDLVYEIETVPLGTGGAIRQALIQCRSNHVFIFNGDTYLDLEATAIETLWQATSEPIIVARAVDDTSRYGRLNTNDNHVVSFAEKGQSGSGLINAGCYVFPRHLLDHFALGQPFSIESDFLAATVQTQPFRVFVTSGLFIDIGIPEDYALAQTLLAGIHP